MINVIGISIILGSVVLHFLAIVFASKRAVRARVNPDYDVVQPAQPDMPQATVDFFKRIETELVPEGFVPTIYVLDTSFGPRLKSYVAMFRNRPLREEMMAVFMLTDVGRGFEPSTPCVEFSTDFLDGAGVCTNNTTTPTPWPPRPGLALCRFPMVHNAARLWRIHRQMLDRFGSPAPRDYQDSGDEYGLLPAAIAKSWRRLIQRGLYAVDMTDQVYVITWKGAFITGFMLCWPIAMIRKALVQGKARRILKRIEA